MKPEIFRERLYGVPIWCCGGRGLDGVYIHGAGDTPKHAYDAYQNRLHQLSKGELGVYTPPPTPKRGMPDNTTEKGHK